MNDSDARQKIEAELDKNLFVEASAGSGKTTALVQRMTSLVRAGVDISEICAITFTKAAAGEFYDRFQRKLREQKAAETDENIKGYLQNALENIDLCFMGTIDSFSELILREHPAQAHIPSDFTTSAEAALMSAYRSALKCVVSGEYGSELQALYNILRGAQGDADEILITALKVIDQKRDGRLGTPEFGGDESKYYSGIKDMLTGFTSTFVKYKDRAYSGSGEKADLYARKIAPAAALIAADTWENSRAAVNELTALLDGYEFIGTPADLGITDTAYFDKDAALKNQTVYKFTPPAMDLVDNEFIFCTALELAKKAIDKAARQRLSGGRLSFFDAKLALRDMLKEDARGGGRLIRHIRKRHSRYLTDEFQDTDPVQSEILFLLTAKVPCPDPEKCVPLPGSLFIVGDPKQSIYRFRGADIDAFNMVRNRFTGDAGEVVTLTRNFRSSVTLRKKFNSVFSGMPGYTPIEISPAERDEAELYTGFFKYKAYNGKVYQNNIADIIEKLMKDKVKVRDKDTGTLREVRFSDFMVIVPTKYSIGNHIFELNNRGIPVIAEGETLLTTCPAFTELYSIIKALAYPADSQAAFRALTGAVCGLTERELLSERRSISIKKRDTDNPTKIDKAVNMLDSLRFDATRLPPSAFCVRVLDKLHILSHTGGYQAEGLYYALELLRAAEAEGNVFSLKEAADFFTALLCTDKKERTLRFKSDENSVRIANIHKVKGLEENIVILANPVRKKTPPIERTEYNCGDPVSYIFDIQGDDFRSLIKSNIFSRDKLTMEKQAAEAEKQRLLYVAATRARCALIITNTDDDKLTGANESYWRALWLTADKVIETKKSASDNTPRGKVDTEMIYQRFDSGIPGSQLGRASYKLILPSKLKKGTAANKADPEQQDTERPKGSDDMPGATDFLLDTAAPTSRIRTKEGNAALIGTLVHRLMERMVSAPACRDDKEGLLETVLSETPSADSSYRPMLESVYDTATHGGFVQQNGRPQDILAELEGADEISCETPYCYTRENGGRAELCNGVIDLIYRKDGRLYIIDYKTTAEEKYLDEIYALQLDEYTAAVKALTGEDAQAYIYHIDTLE